MLGTTFSETHSLIWTRTKEKCQKSFNRIFIVKLLWNVCVAPLSLIQSLKLGSCQWKCRKLSKPRDKIHPRCTTYADLPSASSLVGQRPFLAMRAETLSGSFCSTACRSLSSLLVQSGLWTGRQCQRGHDCKLAEQTTLLISWNARTMATLT